VGGGKPGAQIKRADKSGARIALIVGDDEAAAGTVQVKFLREERPQATVTRSELLSQLPGLLSSSR
jgi:histidyl-tRNA synthetase